MYTQEISQPIIDLQKLSPASRTEGLSGFMRLRNEEEFLALSIESWLPILDELIIVYNNCQDKTGDIVEKYAGLYPDKVKAYHYLPIVYPPGSDEFKDREPDDYHSLVNYYNFALTQTTRSWAIKIDGDLIVPSSQKQEELRQIYFDMKDASRDKIQPVSGVNIFAMGGGIYVPGSSPYCGLWGDLSLFYVDETTYYKKADSGIVETLNLEGKSILPGVFGYYHLKFARADFGIANYELKSNKKSIYLAQLWSFLIHFNPKPLEIVLSDIEHTLPFPNNLLEVMSMRKNYRLEAMRYLWRSSHSLGSVRLLIEKECSYLGKKYSIIRKLNSFSRVLKQVLRVR